MNDRQRAAFLSRVKGLNLDQWESFKKNSPKMQQSIRDPLAKPMTALNTKEVASMTRNSPRFAELKRQLAQLGGKK